MLDAAECRGFEIVETTKGSNGYPERLGKAVTGFDDFAEAEAFADEFGGSVVKLWKKHGWQLWTNAWRVYDAFNLDASWFGDNYECFDDCGKYWEIERERFAKWVSKSKNPFAFDEELQRIQEIYEAIEYLGENEQVLINWEGESFEVIKKKAMRYDIDCTIGIIAVVLED